MKKQHFFSLIGLLFLLSSCQSLSNAKGELALNLDFEQVEKGLPTGWEIVGSPEIILGLDSVHVKSGKYAVFIENQKDSAALKVLRIALPYNYIGKKISLSGYIKTENLMGGFAGLTMRIDPQLAFENMISKGVKGTAEWQKYEIQLPLFPEKTERIYIGALMSGKGKMWLDGLEVKVDGKSLDDPSLEVKALKPIDTAFDNGSHIVMPTLDNQTLENLSLLGRVWGFMKYHHPEIAKGNYNWDKELFRLLPDYLKSKNSADRDKLLLSWIAQYGRLPHCNSCIETGSDAILKPDLSWINQSGLSEKLQHQLHEIYQNRSQGAQHYISVHPAVGHPDFKNEIHYANMPYPDMGYRLLALYKYWNMIQYYFPYKALTDKDWNIVLQEYIRKFIDAKDELAYELAAIQLIGEVKDTHANLWSGADKIQEQRGNNYSPFKVYFVENKLVVSAYYKSAKVNTTNLRIGDIITHINGKAVESIVDSLRAYYPHSNEASLRRDIAPDLLRSSESSLQINYLSRNKSDKIQQTKIKLYDQKDLEVKHWAAEKSSAATYQQLSKDVGYFSLANVQHADIDTLQERLANLKGIVVDLRNYPANFVVLRLASLFLSERTAFVQFSKANLDNPGEFRMGLGTILEPLNQKYSYKSKKNQKVFTGKLVVLVNENTQSQAEFTAMALRAVPNSVIIGSETAGADGNISTIYLPGGLVTVISGIGIYYPDGQGTQRIGIVPDLVVQPTVAGLINGKDELLEKALEILKSY